MKQKEIAKQKKSKEKNSLTEVLSAIELMQKVESIDAKFDSKDFVQLDDGKVKFDYSTNLIDKQMDYSELFSYLNSKAKENPYTSYESVDEEKKQEDNLDVKESISYEEVEEVIKTKKFNDMLSRSTLFQMPPSVKERFDWFKIFNKAYLDLMYDMI